VETARHPLETHGPKVLASRMVRDYFHQLYTPAALSSRALSADGFQPARELASWRSTVVGAWPGVRVVHVETGGVGDAPAVGATLSLRASVDLAGLSTDDVVVEALYGRVDEHDQLLSPERLVLSPAGTGEDGLPRYDGQVPLERAGSYGYTVRVLPRHPLLAGTAELALVTTA
jgi:starch phosphorylase